MPVNSMAIIFSVLIFVILVIFISRIKIVPQARSYVVERLGAYKATLKTGVHFLVPFIDRVAINGNVTLKEQVLDSPPQPVITKDNVQIQVDTVVFFQITDPKLYV